MIHNRAQELTGHEEILIELAQCLTQESGLLIFAERSPAVRQGRPVQISVAGLAQEDSVTLYLAWQEPTEPDLILLHLLEALAQKIYQDLLDSRDKNQMQETGSWEWLMREGERQKWNCKKFAQHVSHYALPPLNQGFPIYIQCAPWHSKIMKVMANLYPQAQVCWSQKPNLFLWLPVGTPNLSRAELKARGETLIQEVYSLLADELGVSTVVLVGKPSENNLWGGYLEVKELAVLHARFFAGESGLTSWNLGLAFLFSTLSTISAEQYWEGLLGALSDDLIETLSVFLDHDLSIGDTAKVLFIHRNTLNYRLDRITELTGYNPRRLKKAVYFYLAVWLKKHLK